MKKSWGTILICALILNGISLLALYSSLHQGGEFKEVIIFKRQVAWIIISWICMAVFMLIN